MAKEKDEKENPKSKSSNGFLGVILVLIILGGLGGFVFHKYHQFQASNYNLQAENKELRADKVSSTSKSIAFAIEVAQDEGEKEAGQRLKIKLEAKKAEARELEKEAELYREIARDHQEKSSLYWSRVKKKIAHWKTGLTGLIRKK